MPTINDLILAIRDAGEYEPDAMITLTLYANDEKWAQLLPEKINLSFPFNQTPNDLLSELEIPNADMAIVGFWEAKLFVDIKTSSMTVDQLCGFLNAYLTVAFGSANIGEYHVSFEIAERGRIEADSTQEFLRKIVALKRHFEGKST